MSPASYRRSMPELGYRLAAFTDGEGHFGIVRQRKATGTYVYGVVFVIPLRRDDRAILERFQDEVGVGSLYDVERHNKWGNPQSRWVVQNKADCQRLVEIFDEFPLWSKKQRDYAIWREAVLYMQGPRPEGSVPLARWFDEIKAVRQYDAPEVEAYELEPLPTLFDEVSE